MTDNLTREQRSLTMSKIRSKWTEHEKKIHNYLKGLKIKHKMHPKISGNPDIIIPDKKTAIFLHGCFWHQCPKHYIAPKTNVEYWLPKIEANIKRDLKNMKSLRKGGWRIKRIWEHDIRNDFEKSLEKILK